LTSRQGEERWVFAAAELADERGLAIGVDLAEEMVARTAADIRARGITNAEVRMADGERLSEFVDGEFSAVPTSAAHGSSRAPLASRAGRCSHRRLRVGSAARSCGRRRAGVQWRLRKTAPMRAIVLNSFSGLDALELSETADPTPGDGEELVRIRAAALGPWDLSGANGAFAAIGGSSEFPQVQGWDFAGEAGDGRRVLGFVAQPWMGIGTFAEQIAVPSALLAPLQDALSFEEGGALSVCALTARLLVEAAAVTADRLVLVTGAAGMVGGFAAQLVRARGGRVVAAVRERDADEARRLGADAVVSTGDDLEVEVRGRWQDGVDACLDYRRARRRRPCLRSRRRGVRHLVPTGCARRRARHRAPDGAGAARRHSDRRAGAARAPRAS
jgi:NADPH:quinone reductase-like Zn-dependent oxidoreductase